DIADDVAADAYQRAVTHLHAVHDARAAPDIAVASQPSAARNGDVRADHRPVIDACIVMDDRVRQHADVIADTGVAGDDCAGHDEDVVSDAGQRGEARGRVDHPRETRRIQAQSVDD